MESPPRSGHRRARRSLFSVYMCVLERSTHATRRHTLRYSVRGSAAQIVHVLNLQADYLSCTLMSTLHTVKSITLAHDRACLETLARGQLRQRLGGRAIRI